MQKVKIDIQLKNQKSYTSMAVHKLNNQTGIVVETNEVDGLRTDRVLIKFDKPIEGLYTYVTKHAYFWFNKDDIKVIEGVKK